MTDSDYMHLAITEAQKGIGLTSPNPPVGAVIVQNGKVIGRGYHHKAGNPHAEREAISDAKTLGNDLAGATIYVTLEPCSTTGKTPACTDGVIEAGIKKVIYGAQDPNPAHAGNADIILTDRGIQVESGVEKEACEALIRPFAKRFTTGLPWLIAKTATSIDGRITRPKGEGQWLTGTEARAEVHRIRATVDAIITGGKTVRKDNPSLTIRGEAFNPKKQQPYRVILTHSGRQSLPPESHLFTDEYAERTIVHQDKTFTETLQELADLGCNSVLLECGGVLMRQFFEQELVDEIALFIAPMITGGNDLGFGIGDHLKRSLHLTDTSSQTLGKDTLIRGIIDRSHFAH